MKFLKSYIFQGALILNYLDRFLKYFVKCRAKFSVIGLLRKSEDNEEI